jgi:small-conductance mechanosensitive channel
MPSPRHGAPLSLYHSKGDCFTSISPSRWSPRATTRRFGGIVAEAEDLGQPNTDEARRRARMRILLPIFRNILYLVVIAVAVLMALAAMGFEIGPLVARLSVVGVAIGFGCPNFVRDIVAGMFYLLHDDPCRICPTTGGKR